MEYLVQYGKAAKRSGKQSNTHKYGLLWLILAGMICVHLINYLDISIIELMVPGDMEVTLPAINRLVEALASGDSIGDSVSAFCYDVFQTA